MVVGCEVTITRVAAELPKVWPWRPYSISHAVAVDWSVQSTSIDEVEAPVEVMPSTGAQVGM